MARRLHKHRMTMNVRYGHIHRFQTGCTCGWNSIPLRSKQSALRAFGRHSRPGASKIAMKPRPVTPESDLPDFPRALLTAAVA